jgi:Pyridoxamine 5'-phosphate oxidase
LLTWDEFAKFQPEMAKFGLKRLEYHVMYLATVRKNGYPRLHPFTPFVASGHLFAFMEPTSPKGLDLQRNELYAMHSLVTNMNGTNGEFTIVGRARLVADPATRDLAVKGCPYSPKDRYICFEFKLEECMTNTYVDGVPNTRHWMEKSRV